jgi:hypothetical protein
MKPFLWRSLAFCSLFALLTAGPVWAQSRGHRGHGANPSNHTWRADRDGNNDSARDWRGDRDRWNFGGANRPAGWSQGKKTGWGNCDVPPGQAKKMGCSPVWAMRNNTWRGQRQGNQWTRSDRQRRNSRQYRRERRDRNDDRDRDRDRRER